MKAVVQRVTEARVEIDGSAVGEVGRGLMVLFCAERGDADADADYFAGKIARMRLFPDGDGKTNLSVADVRGGVLAVSQFTLAADWRKGNRPGFSNAEEPARARALYIRFCEALAATGVPVERGVFAAEMKVHLVNDGPFTIVMD